MNEFTNFVIMLGLQGIASAIAILLVYYIKTLSNKEKGEVIDPEEIHDL